MGELRLNVSTACVTVPIYDLDSEGNEIKIGAFRFNPSDLDIAKRYDQVIEKLNNMEISEDIDKVLELSDEIKTQIDYLLGFKVSDDIFAHCNPFSPTANGDLFIEVVLDGIANIVESETKQRIEKKQARIKKATKKYSK